MTQQITCSHPKFNKTINSEQLEEIVEAILNGKYSWACVLILRIAGYNPLNYIPYRTYKRLIKENCQIGSSQQRKADHLKVVNQDDATPSDSRASQNGLSKIVDLNYLEPVSEKNSLLHGRGPEAWCLSENRDDYLTRELSRFG